MSKAKFLSLVFSHTKASQTQQSPSSLSQHSQATRRIMSLSARELCSHSNSSALPSRHPSQQRKLPSSSELLPTPPSRNHQLRPSNLHLPSQLRLASRTSLAYSTLQIHPEPHPCADRTQPYIWRRRGRPSDLAFARIKRYGAAVDSEPELRFFGKVVWRRRKGRRGKDGRAFRG